MERSTTGTVALALLTSMGMPGSAVRAEPVSTAAPAAEVSAVWIERKQLFTYFGQTTYYSCYGLRDKVRYILKQVGARPDLSVSTSCVESGGSGVEALPSVRIKAAFATEATPELLQRLAEDASERELVARVRGKGDDVDSATAQFPAVRHRVEFESERRGRIEDGDCELLEQLVRQVLEPAGLRVAADSRLACMRHSIPTGSVHLVLDTLRPAPQPDAPTDS
ncbi:MAG: hypothetical protein K0R70_3 [Steroidobacteraceae bacterium]|nr:hypothetical protein [Steroidobacteraceae bacterium]